jgi:hypothetical protein
LIHYANTITGASKFAEYHWIFGGIGENELIEVEGFGGGASGDGIDRFDTANGSPANTVMLATSAGHSDDFGLFPEDVGFPMTNTLGTWPDLIRSDIVAYETSGGGGCLVGNINWSCSLAWEGYENNVAKVTGHVLSGFVSGIPIN